MLQTGKVGVAESNTGNYGCTLKKTFSVYYNNYWFSYYPYIIYHNFSINRTSIYFIQPIL